MNHNSKIQILYYSGTGGTAMVAKEFLEHLTQQGHFCRMQQITCQSSWEYEEHDLLILLFPVHAFNAPEAVYQWIRHLETVEGTPAAVISVSGGGEVSPNTACRLSTIQRLQKKGYRVGYETMMVMPSNWMVAPHDSLAAYLLQVLPQKVQHIANQITSGEPKRSTPLLVDRVFSAFGEFEKPAGRLWGRFIRPNEACTGCGWCAGNCPAGNITMQDGRPRFHGRCHMCLKCTYGCPQKALVPGMGKFVLIKQGYDLKAWSRMVPLTEVPNIEELTKGSFWSGVRTYLQE